MKRLLLIALLLIGIFSTAAEEKKDPLASLYDMMEAMNDNEQCCDSIQQWLSNYQEEHPDISRDTIYAEGELTYSLVCAMIDKDEESASAYADAIGIFQKATGEKCAGYGTALVLWSIVNNDGGLYDAAIKLCEKALKTGLDNDEDIACACFNLSNYCTELGYYSEAIEYAKQAGDILMNLDEMKLEYALILANCASTLYSFGYDDAVRSYCTKVLQVIDSTPADAKNTEDYARLLLALSGIYNAMGCPDGGRSLCAEVLNILDGLSADGESSANWDRVTALADLGAYYQILGDTEAAIAREEAAIQILNTIAQSDSISDVKSQPDYADHLYDLAKYHFVNADNRFFKQDFVTAKEEYGKATELLKEWCPIVRNNVLYNIGRLTVNERWSFWDRYRSEFTYFVPWVMINSGKTDISTFLYDYTALFSKGLMLSTEVEISKLVQKNPNVQVMTAVLENMNKGTLSFSDIKNSNEMVKSRNRKAMDSSYSTFESNLSVTWDSVQGKLCNNDIAIEFISYLEYVSTDSALFRYAALTVCKGDTAPVLTKLFTEQEMEKFINKNRDYYETYKNASIDSLVWGPLRDRLAGKKRVFFSPVGMLYGIGIEYLPSVLDTMKCYRLSSTRELVIKREQPQRESAALFGEISYYKGSFDEKNSSKGIEQGTQLDQLGDNVEAIKNELRLINDISIIERKGEDASETEFKKLSGAGVNILNVYTHGDYLKDDMDFFQYSKYPSFKKMLQYQKSPESAVLSRSLLYMANAEDVLYAEDAEFEDNDDGMLTAQEISEMNLQGLDLVFLCACVTGKGVVDYGEGVLGLPRGFKTAGARTVVMSLKSVKANATKLLQQKFYQYYAQGESKRESLRRAQKDVAANSGLREDGFAEEGYAFILLDDVPTPVPHVTWEVKEDSVVVTAAGDGDVVLYVDGDEVKSPCALARGEETFEIRAYATAHVKGLDESAGDEEVIIVPAIGASVATAGAGDVALPINDSGD